MLNEQSASDLLDPIVSISVKRDLQKAGESVIASRRNSSVRLYNTIGKTSNRDLQHIDFSHEDLKDTMDDADHVAIDEKNNDIGETSIYKELNRNSKNNFN